MSEVFCEEIAHRAGFIVSVGNWISPEGGLVTGKTYDTHHWETIKEHLGYEPDTKTDSHLKWMNDQVSEGYMRLVFRNDVLFQVGCHTKEEIWGDAANCKMLIGILHKIPEIEVHIFSRTFYILGKADDIANQEFGRLQIKEE